VLVEGREHDHLVVLGARHITFLLQSPPRDPLGGRNPFFSGPRRRLSWIEQVGNNAIRTELVRRVRGCKELQTNRKLPAEGRKQALECEETVSTTNPEHPFSMLMRGHRKPKRCLEGGPTTNKHRGICRPQLRATSVIEQGGPCVLQGLRRLGQGATRTLRRECAVKGRDDYPCRHASSIRIGRWAYSPPIRPPTPSGVIMTTQFYHDAAVIALRR
jgi:hypothetical protein